jgi:Rad3-related DNA helicase
MQHYFEQRLGRGFAYAMLYPGLQRVIQAAGRVIRSPDDRGVIVLIGRRFATPEILASLPEHWYRHQPEELLAADLPAELEAFWAG